MYRNDISKIKLTMKQAGIISFETLVFNVLIGFHCLIEIFLPVNEDF